MSGAILQSELSGLIQESKRKHPDVKAAAEKSFNDLKAIQLTSEAQLAGDLLRKPSFVDPFLLACKTHNAKLVTSGVVCLQRLAASHALSPERLRDVLEALRGVTSSSFDVQIKILQTLPSLCQNYPSDVYGRLLFTCLEICEALQSTKTTVVRSTASATLQQLVSTTFERIADEDDGAHSENLSKVHIGHEIKGLGSAATDGFEVFEDLCGIADGVGAKKLKFSTLSPTFVFDLIITILTSNEKVFQDHSELLFICRTKLMPMLHRHLSAKLSFPITIRSLKTLYLLVSRHLAYLQDETETALALLVHFLDPEASLCWKRAACMETLRNITQSFPLLCQIFDNFDMKAGRIDIVSKLMATLAKIAAEKPALIGLGHQSTMPARLTDEEESRQQQASLEASGVEGVIGATVTAEPHVTGISSAWSLPKTPCLEQLDKTDAPRLPETYIYSLVFDCISAVSEGLARSVMPMSVSHSGRKTQLESDGPHQKSNDKSVSSDENKSAAACPATESQRSLELIKNPKAAAHPRSEWTKTAATLVTSCWPAFLAICGIFLNATLDAEYYHNLIRAIQKLGQAASELGLATPRDAFLTALAKAAVPSHPLQTGPTTDPRKDEPSPKIRPADNAGSTVTKPSSKSATESRVSTNADLSLLTGRNLLCVRALLNLGIALGPTFSQEAWFILLETLLQAEQLMNSSAPLLVDRNGKVTEDIPNSEARSWRASLIGEIGAVQSASKKMFASTAHLDNATFSGFLRALLCLSLSTESVHDREDAVSRVGTSFSRRVGRMHQSSRSTSGPLVKADVKDTEALFVLNKISEVARSNLQRFVRDSAADSWWSLITASLLRVIHSHTAGPDIRRRGARLLDTISLGILQILDDEDVSLQRDVQYRCISVLQTQIDGLYQQDPSSISETRSVDLDIHEHAIETLITVVEQHGEKLLASWETIFKLGRTIFEEQASPDGSNIHEVAQANDVLARSVKLISIGFRLLQLIGSDFLNFLPLQHLIYFIEVLLLFGRQHDDLNVSLTSTTFFWNLADFLQSGQKHPLLSDLAEVPTEEFLVHQITEAEDPADLVGSLWLVLLLRLNVLTMDSRSEVRNGAIQVMLRIMDASGQFLSPRGWHICLSLVLMRLLESHASSLAIIRWKGQDADHKSFQDWCASTVSLLEGSINLVCRFVHTISVDENFPVIWEKIFQVLGSIFITPSLPVLFAGFHGMTLLLSSLKKVNYRDARLAEPALRLWMQHHPADIVNHPEMGNVDDIDRKSNQEAFTAHAEVLVRLCETLPSTKLDQIEARDMMQALRKTIFQCVHPPFGSDVHKMAPEQEHVLAILQLFSATQTSKSTEYYDTLFDFIQVAFRDEGGLEAEPGLHPPVKQDRTLRSGQSPSFVALSSRCIDLLESDVLKTAHYEAVAQNILTIGLALNVLSNTIKAKYMARRHRGNSLLWRKATSSALAIVEAICSNSYSMVDQEIMLAMNDVYGSAIEVAAGILSYGGLNEMDQLLGGDTLAADEEHDMGAFRRLSSNLIPALTKLKDVAGTTHRNSTSEIHRRFVIHLFRASMIAAPHYADLPSEKDLLCSPLSSLLQVRPGTIKELVYHVRGKIPYLALETLFRLTAAFNGDRLQDHEALTAKIALAKTAAPYVVLRAAHTIKSFIADQPLRGPMPMPSRLRVEMLYVLRLCLELRSEDQAYISKPGSQEGVCRDGKGHLKVLYPLILRMWKVWGRVPRGGFSWISDQDGVEIEKCLHQWMELCSESWELAGFNS